MAYIGKQPVVGNFVKLDAITTSATATYNLLNGGVAYFPQTANNCIVSLNGVIQSPTSAYTISGSTIVFSDALTSSDTIDFILVLGDVLSIGTPSDSTITTAKLASDLVVPFGKGGTGLTALGTSLQSLRVNSGATALEFATINAGTPTVQTYDTGTGATWTKPTTANWIQINIWGGGGSGGKGASNAPAGGGGGGAYNTLIVPFSYLAGAVTYTVGAGGASQTVGSTVGNAGGTTSVSIADYNGTGVTKTFYAYGGGAGGFNTAGGLGGGGGGIISAGGNGGTGAVNTLISNTSQTTTPTSGGGFPSYYFYDTNPCASGGSLPTVNPFGGGFGGGTFLKGGTGAQISAYFWYPTYGGGGGGYGKDTAGTTESNAGSSQYGGGGGGGAANSGTAGVGGTSIFGGAGSNGTIDANNSSAGTTPAGGSGGTEGGNSGAGGSGRVQFIYW